MLNIGMTELLAFGIISLLVLGPDKLPEAARFAGTWYGKLKRMISNVQNDIDRELRLSELREQMQSEMQRIQALEQKMQTQMHELQQQSQPAKSQVLPNAVPDNKNSPLFYIFIEKPVFLTVYLTASSICDKEIFKEPSISIMPAISPLNEFKVAV